MFNQLSEYLKNNQQEIIIYGILFLLAVIVIVGVVIQINKYLYRKHVDFGRKHFDLGELDKSIQEFNIAQKLAKKPLSGKKSDVENTSFQLARVCIAASKWDEAIDALTECVGISPDKAKYHVSLVENYLRTGEYYQARESLGKAFDLVSPEAVNEIRQERMHTFMRDGENAEIMENLNRLKSPLAVSESESLDKLEILKPDFEGREFILKGLAGGEKDNLNLAGLYIRRYILEENGLGERMEDETDREEREPEEDGIEENDTRDAAFYLAKAREALDMLEMNPESAEFYNALAFLAAQEGDFKLAEENYEKAITYNPQYAETYYSLGLLCLDESNDPERAMENLENAVERDPKLAKAHHNLALLLLGSGKDKEKVKHHFSEAIRINPLFADVYWDLALILARKDFKEFLLG
uniref:Tetratricopeptide repeat-containing protein n=1 Tax=Candidatus Kentrum sp. LPFa TaxID=2126335 RepID=A0A450WLI9_9GAMM|nr:MAG: Tetratricopeptide repeat-containing protein [Candidatus Kentron sp. LPFa]